MTHLFLPLPINVFFFFYSLMSVIRTHPLLGSHKKETKFSQHFPLHPAQRGFQGDAPLASGAEML